MDIMVKIIVDTKALLPPTVIQVIFTNVMSAFCRAELVNKKTRIDDDWVGYFVTNVKYFIKR